MIPMIASRPRLVTVLLLAFAMATIACPAHAQGGCVDSPENPTAVLALTGFAAAVTRIVRSKPLRRARNFPQAK